MNTIQEIAADIAQELRDDPTRWTNGKYARNGLGQGTLVFDEAACTWCLEGHIIRRSPNIQGVYAFTKAAGRSNLATWNDQPKRTVEEVIDLCDKVAALIPEES